MDIYTSALSPAMDIGAGFYLLVVAVLSIVGNLVVILMAIKRSSRMKPPELLSVNLALTDLGAALSMYPLSVASAFSHRWLGGDVTCIYYGWVGFFFGVASIANLTILAIVRFIVSLNLSSPKEKISWRTVKMLCVFIWLYAFMWALLPILGWGRYGPEPFHLSCSLAWDQMKHEGFYFVICMFSFNLALPTLIIFLCYFGISFNLYFTYKSTNSNLIANIVRLHRRMLTIAVLLSIGFLASWMPYSLVSLWSIFRDSSTIAPEISLLPCLFAKTSTVYNPFIYYICSQSFKMEVQKLCCICQGPIRCQASNVISNTSIYMVSYDQKTSTVGHSTMQRIAMSETVTQELN